MGPDTNGADLCLGLIEVESRELGPIAYAFDFASGLLSVHDQGLPFVRVLAEDSSISSVSYLRTPTKVSPWQSLNSVQNFLWVFYVIFRGARWASPSPGRGKTAAPEGLPCSPCLGPKAPGSTQNPSQHRGKTGVLFPPDGRALQST